MFGRLPKIYRWRTAAVVLLICMIAGGWFAYHAQLPVVVPLGVVMGGLGGVLLAYVAVHQSSPRPRAVRVRHRH